MGSWLKLVFNKPSKMILDKLSISLLIIIFVSNVDATNSCIEDWLSMKAHTAEGNELTNEKIKITLEVQGIDKDYKGKYSFNMPLTVDGEDNSVLINNEPYFINQDGNKCIWKKNATWWIGNCTEIDQNNGFAFMDNCDCPWPSKNEDDNHQTCKKCSWSKYPSNKRLSCNPRDDYECELGVGFLSKHYGTYDWVGHLCYDNLVDHKFNGTAAGDQCAGCVRPQHNTAGGIVRQIKRRTQRLSSRKSCKNQGGVLRLRLHPPPRIIICDRRQKF